MRLSESALPLSGEMANQYQSLSKGRYADLPPDSSRSTRIFGFSERRAARAQPAVPNESVDVLRLGHIQERTTYLRQQ